MEEEDHSFDLRKMFREERVANKAYGHESEDEKRAVPALRCVVRVAVNGKALKRCSGEIGCRCHECLPCNNRLPCGYVSFLLFPPIFNYAPLCYLNSPSSDIAQRNLPALWREHICPMILSSSGGPHADKLRHGRANCCPADPA